MSAATAALAYAVLMLLGEVLYGWLFQRAANDVRGGRLFGMAYGFVLWMLGPVPLLWGLLTGVLFPLIHRHLHMSPEGPAKLGIARYQAGGGGPDADASAASFPQVLAMLKEPSAQSSSPVREPFSKCPIQ